MMMKTPGSFLTYEDAVDSADRLLDQQPACNKLINAEVLLQNGKAVTLAKVRKRAVGPDGATTGTHDDNPIMNTVVYEVEFPDGQVKEHAANVIADNTL